MDPPKVLARPAMPKSQRISADSSYFPQTPPPSTSKTGGNKYSASHLLRPEVIQLRRRGRMMSSDDEATITSLNGTQRGPRSPNPEELSDGANGEPIVQDFAERYIPREFQPQGAPSPNIQHISQLQLSSDEEVTSGPDLSRRGIHIPSRTRQVIREIPNSSIAYIPAVHNQWCREDARRVALRQFQ